MRYTRLSNSTTYDAKASSEGRQDSASVGGVAVVSMIAVGEIARVHVPLQIRDHRLGCEVATLQARELLLLPPRARAQPPRVPARVPGAQEPAAIMCHGKLRPSAQQRHVCACVWLVHHTVMACVRSLVLLTGRRRPPGPLARVRSIEMLPKLRSPSRTVAKSSGDTLGSSEGSDSDSTGAVASLASPLASAVAGATTGSAAVLSLGASVGAVSTVCSLGTGRSGSATASCGWRSASSAA